MKLHLIRCHYFTHLNECRYNYCDSNWKFIYSDVTKNYNNESTFVTHYITNLIHLRDMFQGRCTPIFNQFSTADLS